MYTIHPMYVWWYCGGIVVALWWYCGGIEVSVALQYTVPQEDFPTDFVPHNLGPQKFVLLKLSQSPETRRKSVLKKS